MTVLENQTVGDRANAIFKERIKPLVVGEDPNDFLAIDIVSGDYAIASDDVTPSDKLRKQHHGAQIFVRRVGDEAAYTVGGGYQE